MVQRDNTLHIISSLDEFKTASKPAPTDLDTVSDKEMRGDILSKLSFNYRLFYYSVHDLVVAGVMLFIIYEEVFIEYLQSKMSKLVKSTPAIKKSKRYKLKKKGQKDIVFSWAKTNDQNKAWKDYKNAYAKQQCCTIPADYMRLVKARWTDYFKPLNLINLRQPRIYRMKLLGKEDDHILKKLVPVSADIKIKGQDNETQRKRAKRNADGTPMKRTRRDKSTDKGRAREGEELRWELGDIIYEVDEDGDYPYYHQKSDAYASSVFKTLLNIFAPDFDLLPKLIKLDLELLDGIKPLNELIDKANENPRKHYVRKGDMMIPEDFIISNVVEHPTDNAFAVRLKGKALTEAEEDEDDTYELKTSRKWIKRWGQFMNEYKGDRGRKFTIRLDKAIDKITNQEGEIIKAEELKEKQEQYILKQGDKEVDFAKSSFTGFGFKLPKMKEETVDEPVDDDDDDDDDDDEDKDNDKKPIDEEEDDGSGVGFIKKKEEEPIDESSSDEEEDEEALRKLTEKKKIVDLVHYINYIYNLTNSPTVSPYDEEGKKIYKDFKKEEIKRIEEGGNARTLDELKVKVKQYTKEEKQKRAQERYKKANPDKEVDFAKPSGFSFKSKVPEFKEEPKEKTLQEKQEEYKLKQKDKEVDFAKPSGITGINIMNMTPKILDEINTRIRMTEQEIFKGFNFEEEGKTVTAEELEIHLNTGSAQMMQMLYLQKTFDMCYLGTQESVKNKTQTYSGLSAVEGGGYKVKGWRIIVWKPNKKDTTKQSTFEKKDNTYVSVMGQTYIKGTKEIKKRLDKCIRDKLRYAFISLVFGKNKGKGKGGTSHANMLIFDLKDKKMYRYEPHGAKTGAYTLIKFNDWLNSLLTDMGNKLGFAYRPPSDFCIKPTIAEIKRISKVLREARENPVAYPVEQQELIKKLRHKGMLRTGAQSVEDDAERTTKDIVGKKEVGGYCAYWSMYFMFIRLKYPDDSPTQLRQRVMKGRNSEQLYNIIKGWSRFMARQRGDIMEEYEKELIRTNASEKYKGEITKLKEEGVGLMPKLFENWLYEQFSRS